MTIPCTRLSLNKFRSFKRVSFTLAMALIVITTMAVGVYVVLAADQFFAGDGSALTATKWGTSAAGPFTSAFISNNVANFSTVNGTGSGAAGITVSGIVATENFTYSTPSGTLLTNGTVAPITVSTGKVLNLSSIGFSTAAGTGFTKNGGGVLFTANANAYTGGFTLNQGTLVAGGVNAMGSGGALTINGGTIAGSNTRDFTGKYTGGITVGGDLQLGALSTDVALSSNTANLTFSNNMALGAATRTITIGANGIYTLGGIISGNSGSGLTVANASGATGKLTLTGANNYTGDTTINGGTLALSTAGSIANSPNIVLAGGSTIDVTGLTTSLTLASGQGLKATGTTTTGTIATAATKGLTTAANSPLQFTAFNGTTAPLTISGTGTVTLASGNPVTVNTTTALGAGDYILINNGTGTVAGAAPTSLTIGGSGLAANTTASLQITGSQLVLHVINNPIITVTGGPLAFGSINVGSTSAEQTYTVSGSNLTANLVVTAPTDFQVSITSGGVFGSTVILTPTSGTVATTTIYVRFAPTTAGAKSGNVTNASTGATTQNVTVSGTGVTPPAITVTGGPLTFSNTAVGATSAEQTYTVSGSNLTADITVTAPSTDFQVSKTTGTGFVSSVTFTQSSGSVAPSTVFVRFTPQSTGVKNGDITNASTGATTQNVAVSGTGVQPGSLQFESATYSVAESGPTVTLNVTRTGGSDGAVGVSYTTVDGTATSGAGNDYTTKTGTLSWTAGETATKSITVDINDDTTFEGSEDFSVNINTPTGGATLGSPNSATVTITDNEITPTISIGNAPVNEGDGNAVFTVTQSGLSAFNTTFQYSTADGTATAGSDYTAATNVAGTIAAGNTTTTISIPITDDSLYESAETFTVTLSNPANATIATGTGTGTITDNDTAPAFSIDDVMHMEGNTGTTAYTFTVTKTGTTALNATVDYATVDGTATAVSGDYLAQNNTLTFLPADTTKQLTVLVNGDTTVEPDETFTIHLSNPTNATIADADGTGTIQNDDTGVGPTLGSYGDTTISLSGDTTIVPAAPPANTTYATATTTADFKGKLEADPATGVVRITNAHPMRALPTDFYTVTVTAFDGAGASTTQTFKLTVTTPATCSAVVFAPAANSGVGSSPLSVAVGDFNGDGRQDLVTANRDSNTVSVLLRTSDNSGFDPKVDYAAGSQPFAVAVSDFNGDGRQDIVAVNRNDNSVSVLLRTSDNSGFAPKVDYAVGNNPFSVAVGDFNGDGRQDIVTANRNDNSVSVLLRTSDNTGFDPKVDYAAGSGPRSVAVGDFNGDGKQDLATANFDSNTVSVLLRASGNTGFDPKVDYAVGSGPFSVAAGDFNGDGKQDIVAANALDNSVSVLLRTSDNTGFDPKVDYAVGNNPFSVAVGDFNGDGRQDIVAANLNGSSVSVLLRTSDNTGFAAKVDYSVGAGSISVAVGDFNGDNLQDLATANLNDSTVSVLQRTCNADPTITAGGTFNRQQGSPASNDTVATVSDPNQPAGSLTVTATTVPTGISVSNIINNNGIVTADIAADCTATVGNNTVVLTVTDNAMGTATASFTVNVTANTAPTLTYASPQAVAFGGALDVTPTTATDNGSITGYTVQSVTPALTTAPTVAASGVVSITNAQPSGSHLITIRATDDCGATTDASFTLNVGDAPTFSINGVTQAEGNSGTTAFTFTVTKTGATNQSASVDFTTVDGSATVADNDYAANSGTLNFAANETTMSVTVLVNGDTAFEADESFTVHLSNPMNATIAAADGTGIIVNDDAAPAGTIITPAPTPTALDNDYTRINNVVQNAVNGQTITLSGTFDWTEANAAASWAKGSDGVANTIDDYSVYVPQNLNGVTFTASSLGAATIQGPGDVPTFDLEGVFYFNGGDNQNWTISNIQFLDFDNAIGMFFGPGGTDAFTGTHISNNRIRIARDLNATVAPADVAQNIGIHYSFGTNQVIEGNTIEIQGDGVSDSANGTFSSDYGMQCNTSGGAVYDGLQIKNNIIRVLHAQNAANPEDVLGIWENAHAHQSNITISGNQFLNEDANSNPVAGNDPALNFQLGFLVTSHSSATTFVKYETNTVKGANLGFQWLPGSNFAGNQPVQLTGNTVTNNATGVFVLSQGVAQLTGNTINNNATGVLVDEQSTVGLTSNTINSNTTGVLVQGVAPSPLTSEVVRPGQAHGAANLRGGGAANLRGRKAVAMPATSAGNGPAVTSPSQSTVTLTSNTIRTNTTGVMVQDQNVATLGFNRIVGNTANGVSNANTSGGTPLAAENNWWGCNAGPNQPGCDKTNGAVDFTPWLILSISANPSTITPGGTSTVTADMTHNFDGTNITDTSAGGVFVPPTPVTFSATEGTVNPTSGTITNGTATTTFTSTSSNNGTASATVDNQTVTTTMAINVTAPSFSIDDVTQAEGNNGMTAYTFTVTKTGATTFSSAVTFTTADDTATVANNDYVANTGTLNFGPNDTTMQVTVLVNGDTTFEPTERFFVNLTNATNATIADSQGVGTITNDEQMPTISINDVFVAEPTAGTSNATFTVTLSGTSSTNVTVSYTTADGTATAPADYVAIAPPQTLTFMAGETTKTINVTINADALTEGNETFTVNLSNPSSNATIADGTGQGTITDPVATGNLLISEFRFRGQTNGPAGSALDEFVELYNNTDQPFTVATTDGSQGFTLAASNDGTNIVVLVTIPSGTVIPARGHFLAVNSGAGNGLTAAPEGGPAVGYSLSGYAVGDASYTTDVADNAGVAVFNTATPANFTLANRLDAAGLNNGNVGANAALFREGAGLTSPGANDGQYAFVRHMETGLPKDTNDNAADFVFVAPDGATYGGVQSVLGAPGPEDCGCYPTNLFPNRSPVQHNADIKASIIDMQVAPTAPPNRVRDTTPHGCNGGVGPSNCTLGTLEIRRRFKNNTGQIVTRLRFRIVDVTTLNSPNPGGAQADLRWLSSDDTNVTITNGSQVTVRGTLLDTPPAQALGGGLNSSGTVNIPGGTLAPNATIDVRFLLGVQTGGNFRFLVNVEGLP